MSYYTDAVLADAPAGYWRMDDASGLIQDSSGNARHATASTGTATYQQPSPIVSDPAAKSILFSGDDWFTVPDSGFDFGNTFTLEVWNKRNTSGIVEAMFDKGATGYSFYFPGGGDDMTLDVNAGGVIVRSSSVTRDTLWHHWAVTKNGATSAVMYKDGVDVSTTYADQTVANTATALHIANNIYNSGKVNGFLAEMAVYPTVLSSARVLAHYNAAFTLSASVAWLTA